MDGCARNRRRAGDAQTEILDLIEENGPMSQYEINQRVRVKKCANVLAALERRGAISSWEDANPASHLPYARAVVRIYGIVDRTKAFVNRGISLLPHSINSEKRLKLAEVCALTGRGKTKIYSDIKAGKFPKPEKDGQKFSRWRAATVLDWMTSQNGSMN
jgi:predicted DNA-binding transcriptional regulator AlpA